MATEPAAVTGKGPPGLQAINCACSSLYPDQPNPLQVTALVKYWSVFICWLSDYNMSHVNLSLMSQVRRPRSIGLCLYVLQQWRTF